ncbi:MAG: acyl-CoA dehydrogenase [Candidatus Abyssobacteria bacterium SURF_5]|uniref:Acyl-CoA dehydrogenase n=1 Tax=Abyssobacteria bacterium (strain SURF_5) TaxID=2093360 RepID=A0A3A4NBA8_ABYX5|nr:MAG: acyl-CoA dehydrogenase [Candidatus Abyssubacteria bacterium SURF_5]
MLNFELSEEQEALRQLARDFARKELKPKVRKLDEGHAFDWGIPKKLHELGFLSLFIPEDHGGGGGKLTDAMLLMEEIGSVEPGVCTTMGATWLAIAPLLFAGTEAQWKKFFPLIVEQGGLGASGTTEPQAGSDLEAKELLPKVCRTVARKVGDEYVVNGTKCFISNAGVASLYVIFAVTDPQRPQETSCLFAVEKDTPGLSYGKVEDKMGLRSSQTGDLIFEDMKLTPLNRIGPEGMGYQIHMTRLANARGPVSSQAVGIARGAYEIAFQYAKERVQGGKLIIEHQAVAQKLAEMAIQIEAARLMVWRACWVNANLLPPNRLYTAMSKVFATDVAVKVAIDAIQVLGGYGYMKDYLVEKSLRDAKVLQIYEGPNEICREAVMEVLND